MFENVKQTNQDIHHIFGYVKDAKTKDYASFLDYSGEADPKHLNKLNYYKKLNQIAFERRFKIKQGNLPTEIIPVDLEEDERNKTEIGQMGETNPWKYAFQGNIKQFNLIE